MAVDHSKNLLLESHLEAGLGVGFTEQKHGKAVAYLESDFGQYLRVYGNVKTLRHAAGEMALGGLVLGRGSGRHVKYCVQKRKS